MFWLRIRKWLITKFWSYADIPFEIAHTDISKKYENPTECKTLLGSFDYDNKHWIIYIKK